MARSGTGRPPDACSSLAVVADALEGSQPWTELTGSWVVAIDRAAERSLNKRIFYI
jgi:hypothetical protein